MSINSYKNKIESNFIINKSIFWDQKDFKKIFKYVPFTHLSYLIVRRIRSNSFCRPTKHFFPSPFAVSSSSYSFRLCKYWRNVSAIFVAPSSTWSRIFSVRLIKNSTTSQCSLKLFSRASKNSSPVCWGINFCEYIHILNFKSCMQWTYHMKLKG